MAVSWTSSQLDAIKIRDNSVIVSAAAGSGKTAVLVERLLEILSDEENKTPADKIIVVTFTKDAASQMKQRLSDAISKRLENEPDNFWLLKQHALIPSAKIATISSFCFDLIRENNKTLGISASFKTMESNEAELLQNTAITNVLERYYKNSNEIMTELIEKTAGSKRNDFALMTIINQILLFLGFIPFPKLWLEQAASCYANGFVEEDNPLLCIYIENLKKKLKNIIKISERACSEMETLDAPKSYEFFSKENDVFKSAYEKLSSEHLKYNDKMDFSFSYDRLPSLRLEKESEEAQTYLKAKTLRDSYKSKSKFQLFTLEEIADDYAENNKIVPKILAIVSDIVDELFALKTEKNVLEFSDAEHFTAKLLTDVKDGKMVKSKLAEELSDFYDIIMIDEYQDVNDTQSLIFRMLSKEGTLTRNGVNLFVVGDVKQAIYGFRYANPKIFTDTLNISEKYSSEDEDESSPSNENFNKAIYLNQNFRSSTDVVDFVNYIFENLMTKKSGDVEYSDGHSLKAGAFYPEKDRSTEIMLIKGCSDGNEIEDDDDEDSAKIVAENLTANVVAKKIESMIFDKVTVNDKGVSRPCESRDFCILLRSKRSSSDYVTALEKVGVKAFSEQVTGYLTSKEIMIIINLLSVINNPLLDIPLASVLLSPMFMLSAEDLATVRLYKSNGKSHLYDSVLAAVSDEAVLPELYAKLTSFLHIYKNLRVFSASNTLSALISEIYESTDFLSSVQAYSDGKQKKANLYLLLSYARSYEDNSFSGLSGFLQYLNNMRASGKDFAGASVISSSENAVSIKTIHSSKGLEYPFVFICETHKQFNKKDDIKDLQLNPNLGIATKIKVRGKLTAYRSFPQEVIALENSADRKNEELRLMYVAMTRAKEQLFIPIICDEKYDKKIANLSDEIAENNSDLSIMSDDALSMQDWILMAVLAHKSGAILQNEVKIKPIKTDAKIKVVTTENSANIVDTAEKVVDKKIEDGIDKTAVAELTNRYKYKYDDSLAKSLAKISTTELLKKSGEIDELSFNLKEPKFDDVSNLTAAEKGTAAHKFMENLPLEKAVNSSKAVADNLLKKGILSENEHKSLQFKKLDAFLSSDIYKRMVSSEVLYREKQFLIEFSEIFDKVPLDKNDNFGYNNKSMLMGTVDCFFLEENRIVVVDYKTDYVKTEDEISKKYSSQVLLYAKALEKIYNKSSSEGYIYSFSLGKAVRVL